jgi:general secretion pathway protein A
MYTSFYNLEHKPFTLNPDPSFLWLGENQQQIFSSLLSGIVDSKGFLLLTGAAGSGKTTLLMALTERLEKNILCAVIADPRLERIDFYNAIGRGFGLKKKFSSKVQFLIHFSHFLHKAEGRNKKVLLVVDNCHNLRQEMLEELRLLASIEKEDVKLLNIFFAGLPEFKDILEKPKNRAVRERLICKAVLPSLNVDETAEYIRHRLKIAGNEEELFTAAAVQAVHRFSQGSPRWINIICDRALAAGSVQAKQNINEKMIESSIRDIDLSATFSAQKGFSQTISSFWRFIGEKALGGSRLMYGLGLLVLFMFGVSLWFAMTPSLETTPGTPAETARLPEMEDIPGSSVPPVAPVLEETDIAIKEEKPLQLQTTIRIRPLVVREKRDNPAPTQ